MLLAAVMTVVSKVLLRRSSVLDLVGLLTDARPAACEMRDWEVGCTVGKFGGF